MLTIVYIAVVLAVCLLVNNLKHKADQEKRVFKNEELERILKWNG